MKLKKKKIESQAPTVQIPEYLSINDLSKITGLSKYYIRSLITNKEILYVAAGRKFLINYKLFTEYCAFPKRDTVCPELS